MITATEQTSSKQLDSRYGSVMAWIAASFISFTLSAYYIGPHIPPQYAQGISIAVLLGLLVSAFARKLFLNPIFSNAMALIVPAALGLVTYAVVNSYAAAGMTDTVVLAGLATIITFGVCAIYGWFSKKSINSWAGKLFAILLAIIGLSLLNAFFFHITGLSLIISIAVVVIFSLYTFMDIQAIRDRSADDIVPSSWYALNIFLDIYNLFMAFLNILGIASKN